jgi:D-glycero-D-manno-heptose 1,7-bisphosphate phosphatase
MNKAVFLDRDGVINNDSGHYYISDPKDFVLNPGVPEFLSWLKSEGYLLIIISNQGGISRGMYSIEDVDILHKKMETLLKESGISFDEIYFCPHHPENERCICRKPDTVQIEKAITRFSISINDSYFIGDRETDIEAGKKMGLKTIKTETNQEMISLIGQIKKTGEFS